MTAARRRQGQQLYAGHGPPRRPQPLPLASASCGTEATQPNPDALPPEAWPCECNAGEESAERTGAQWWNPDGGGDDQFQNSLQHQGGALETISAEAHTAFQAALRSRLGVEPNLRAVDCQAKQPKRDKAKQPKRDKVFLNTTHS